MFIDPDLLYVATLEDLLHMLACTQQMVRNDLVVFVEHRIKQRICSLSTAYCENTMADLRVQELADWLDSKHEAQLERIEKAFDKTWEVAQQHFVPINHLFHPIDHDSVDEWE